MSDVVPFRSNQTAVDLMGDPKHLQLLRRTIAKGLNDGEFDLFVGVARRLGLDPLRNQLRTIIFSANDPEKRSMVIVTKIEGYRAIAARSGQYRPMDSAPVIEYDPDLKSDTNPHGIVRAEYRAYLRDERGDWHPVVGEAYWDEYVPLDNVWGEDPDTGKRCVIGKGLKHDSPWRRMGRVMIAKCAESQALRKGWPEDLSGVYAEEEMARAWADAAPEGARDITYSQTGALIATEVLAHAEAIERRAKVEARYGGKDIILWSFQAGAPLDGVPAGQCVERVDQWLRAEGRTSEDVVWFRAVNKVPIGQLWAASKSDGVELTKLLEAAASALPSKGDDQ